MKRIIFFTILFSAIYIISCMTVPPTFEEKAASVGLTIIWGDYDEKRPVMQELLSKCSPAGKIEELPIKQEGDYLINRAVELGANAVHIYYINAASIKINANDGSPLHYMARFWRCKDPI